MAKRTPRWLLVAFLACWVAVGVSALTPALGQTPQGAASTSRLAQGLAQASAPEASEERQGAPDAPPRRSPRMPMEDAMEEVFELEESDGWGKRLIPTAITTAMLLVVILLLRLVFAKLSAVIKKFHQRRPFSITLQQLQLLSPEVSLRGFLEIVKAARLLLSLTAVFIYLAILPNFFPQTEGIGRRILAYGLEMAGGLWRGVIGYLPNLIAIILVMVATRYALKILKTLFKALREGQLTIPGFYGEWIEPTAKLTQVLVVLLALAFILPNLPGFGSPAFQGISILFGALLTVGGASTVSNLIGGFVTIYTRAFQIGDRIRIGDHTGYVMEKTILSTRIRTSTNEIVTIPNASLAASTIINYTATLRDTEEPLVLQVSISLGYDVPWRKVHDVLISAAQLTTDIAEEPAPEVRQNALSDFYVEYELRACTHAIDRVNAIYSELYQNILDRCSDSDLEILSPHYTYEKAIS